MLVRLPRHCPAYNLTPSTVRSAHAGRTKTGSRRPERQGAGLGTHQWLGRRGRRQFRHQGFQGSRRQTHRRSLLVYEPSGADLGRLFDEAAHGVGEAPRTAFVLPIPSRTLKGKFGKDQLAGSDGATACCSITPASVARRCWASS
jgi:hypothetical protein